MNEVIDDNLIESIFDKNERKCGYAELWISKKCNRKNAIKTAKFFYDKMFRGKDDIHYEKGTLSLYHGGSGRDSDLKNNIKLLFRYPYLFKLRHKINRKFHNYIWGGK